MAAYEDRRIQRDDAERLLASLAGIISAHVVTDSVGLPAEIHVLAGPDLHPKQVVRNVESALSAGLGLTVDRRIVSVAQVQADGEQGANNGGPAASAPTAPSPDTPDQGEDRPPAGASDRPHVPAESAEPDGGGERLEYVRYNARRDARRCICEVELRSGERRITGSGAGPDTMEGRAEAGAKATVDAIRKARAELRIALDGAVVSNSRGRGFVIVSAHMLLDRNTVRLAGAAAIQRSPEEAAILATLQASNRWSS